MKRLVAMALAIAGCAQPPDKELDIAAERVESARDADAAIFAPEALAKADEALAEARRLADKGEYLPSVHAAGRAVEHAHVAFEGATRLGRIVRRRLERSLLELEGLLSIAESRGAAGDELAAHRERFRAIAEKAEAGDVFNALAEAEAFTPELLAFEQRFRD